MKDILITGAAGKIGYELLKTLINSKYSITALDLPSQEAKDKLEAVQEKIKIVYGDVEDRNLVFDLIQKNDIVIDFAGIMPPLANLSEKLTNSTNYLGCKNIVDAINAVNKKCVYIYPSFISIYGLTKAKQKKLKVHGKTEFPDDFYSVSLIRSEEYIKENVANFIIFRMPIVLTKFNYYIKHLKLNRVVDFIVVDDLNEIIIKSIENKKMYKKTFNLSGFKMNSSTFIKKFYKYTGNVNVLNRYVYYGEFEDADKVNNYVKIDYHNAQNYFNRFKHPNYIKKIFNFFKYLVVKRYFKEKN